MSRSIIARILSIYCVARGSTVGGSAPSAATSSWNWRSVASVTLAIASLSGRVRIVTLGARVDLVVDVGDVANVENVIRAVDMAQKPKEDVEDDNRASVADVRVVVDGRAADVEPDRLRVDRREGLLAACQRVVKTKRHRPLRGLIGRRGVGLVGVVGWLHRELWSASSRGRTAQSAAARIGRMIASREASGIRRREPASYGASG